MYSYFLIKTAAGFYETLVKQKQILRLFGSSFSGHIVGALVSIYESKIMSMGLS